MRCEEENRRSDWLAKMALSAATFNISLQQKQHFKHNWRAAFMHQTPKEKPSTCTCFHPPPPSPPFRLDALVCFFNIPSPSHAQRRGFPCCVHGTLEGVCEAGGAGLLRRVRQRGVGGSTVRWSPQSNRAGQPIEIYTCFHATYRRLCESARLESQCREGTM